MAKLLEEIAELESILSDPAKLRGVIATELGEIREKFANDRRTVITHDPGDMNVEDLVDDEELVVTMSRAGYIKAVSADAFRTQGRGGRGVQGRSSRKRTSSTTWSIRRHTPISSCSPTGAGCFGCGPWRFP